MFKLPSYVNLALDILNSKGEAFIVGGCVRDLLLGREPHDYDITTNLKPYEVQELFKDYKQFNNNGLSHGTVTVLIDSYPLEITTYRIDGKYSDGRHPSSVDFTDDLKLDLSRRDFTINAMAYNSNLGLIDFFNGISDLKTGIIRTVGDPYKRFNEDYLRILRALRFKGRFKFNIETNTKYSMQLLAPNLNLISSERINQELHQILISDDILNILLDYKEIIKAIIPEMEKNFDFNQYSKWHFHDVYSHIAYVTSYVKQDFTLRLAALLHDIGKGYCFQEELIDGKLVRHFRGHAEKSCEISRVILNRLRVSNEEKEEILYLILNHDYPLESDKSIKKLILKTKDRSLDLILKLIDLKEADHKDHLINSYDIDNLRNRVIYIYNSLDALTIKDLKINGNDLINLGIKGPKIGFYLNECFNKVFNNELQNDHKILLEYIKEMVNSN